MDSLICPNCQTIAIPGSVFCAHCGFPLTSASNKVSFGKQVWIYFVSFFLPPLGLIWAFKFMRSSDSQKQKITIVAIILTVVGLLLTVWAGFGIFQSAQTQLNSYQNLGL